MGCIDFTVQSKALDAPPRHTHTRTCAHTYARRRLPCWFALRLLRDALGRVEAAACRAAIPLTLVVSAAGLACSVRTLIAQIREGGSAFGPPV